MNNNIDIKTLEAFQDGNHKAFETIFITYYNKTKAFIDGYIKSEPDAEELTEDLFVNLWINRHSIDTSKSFNSYLHTIARNAAINFLKHKYVCDAYLNHNQETGYSSTSEEDLIAKELEMLIDELVGGMPEQRRMIYAQNLPLCGSDKGNDRQQYHADGMGAESPQQRRYRIC